MENIDNLIEIKRGLHRVCNDSLMEKIAELDCCEKFFRDIFGLYGLEYNTEMLEQKRSFIGLAAKYFILFRLDGIVTEGKDGYRSRNPRLVEHLEAVIEKFYEVYNSCEHEEFIEKYVEALGIKDRNLEVLLKSESKKNRDDSLSSFAKAVKKVYKSKEKQGFLTKVNGWCKVVYTSLKETLDKVLKS